MASLAVLFAGDGAGSGDANLDDPLDCFAPKSAEPRAGGQAHGGQQQDGFLGAPGGEAASRPLPVVTSWPPLQQPAAVNMQQRQHVSVQPAPQRTAAPQVHGELAAVPERRAVSHEQLTVGAPAVACSHNLSLLPHTQPQSPSDAYSPDTFAFSEFKSWLRELEHKHHELDRKVAHYAALVRHSLENLRCWGPLCEILHMYIVISKRPELDATTCIRILVLNYVVFGWICCRIVHRKTPVPC